MSTLPSQWSSGGQAAAITCGDAVAVTPPGPATSIPGVSFSGDGGNWLSGTSKNTSKKLLGGIAGTLNCPIGPKSGWNTPKLCDCMSPEIGSEGVCGSKLRNLSWNRTAPPGNVTQSTSAGSSDVSAPSATSPGEV